MIDFKIIEIKRQSHKQYILKVFSMGWFPFIQSLAQSSGVPSDIIKITIGLVSILSLSPLFRFISSRTIRHILNFTVGTIFLLFMLQQVGYFVLAGMILPYFLMTILPHAFITSLVCSIIYLVIAHTYRSMVSYGEWRADCSVYIMILVTKLTYWARWYQKQGEKKKASFVDFMSYNLFFPALLAGPTFSFETFLQFLEQPQKDKKFPLNLLKLMTPFLLAIPIAVTTIICMPQFTQNWVLENEFYLGLPFWQKVLILNPIGFIYRSKYYSAWLIGQACCNFSGISQSPSGQYDKVIAVSLLFELEPNPKKKTQYWNSSFQVWLKDVVYQSLVTRMNSNLALFATFFISAFWHGVYLVYYLIFALWAILIHISKWCYKWSLTLPPSIGDSFLLKVVTWIVAFCMFTPIGMAGAVLEWEGALLFLKDLYYYPLIISPVLLILSLVLIPPRTKTKSQKQSKEN